MLNEKELEKKVNEELEKLIDCSYENLHLSIFHGVAVLNADTYFIARTENLDDSLLSWAVNEYIKITRKWSYEKGQEDIRNQLEKLIYNK